MIDSKWFLTRDDCPWPYCEVYSSVISPTSSISAASVAFSEAQVSARRRLRRRKSNRMSRSCGQGSPRGTYRGDRPLRLHSRGCGKDDNLVRCGTTIRRPLEYPANYPLTRYLSPQFQLIMF